MPDLAALRRSRAEAAVRDRDGVSREEMTPDDTASLLHELQVHQIELEMQNEELRRIQLELDTARARYFDLYDLAPVGYLTLDEGGLILEVNLTAATLLAAARGMLVGHPISQFVFFEDQDIYYRFRKQLLDTGDPRFCELRMVKRDGSLFWALLQGTRVQEGDGSVQCRMVMSEITEKVRLDQAQLFLAQAEWLVMDLDFFQALARFLARHLGADYVCIDRLMGDYLEAETLAVWFDGHFEDNVRYALRDTPCGNAVGKTICCFPSGVRNLFPRDQVLQDMGAESYLGVTLWGSNGQPIGLIAMIGRHPLGDSRLAESTLTLVAVRAAAELEHQRDQEALKASDRQFRSYVENSPIGVFVCDEQAHCLQVNPAGSVITGYSCAELLKLSMPDLLPPESRTSALGVFQELLATGRISSEWPFLRKDGQIGTWALEGVRLSPTRLMAMVTDITERKGAEERQRQLQIQLQQAQKMESLGSLAGGVAHDMNNVLGAILGLATANLEFQDPDSPTFRAFETISKAAVRGGKMVKSLLGFARQSSAEEDVLDMNALLREEVHLLERTTLSKVRLEMDLAEDLRSIRGDASVLTHAFMNLCVNAVDAMPEMGTLTLRSRNADPHWIEVEVEDTGCGMSKEVLDRALDPFFTTKEVGKGTGLGLSMVYSTVKAHHGRMEIQSELGRGTCVKMRFPVCVALSGAPDFVQAPHVAVPHRRLKVMAIDDDDLIQSTLEQIMVALGHSVTASLTGEDALARLEGGYQPDVIILDMNMPGMGGTGTLPRLRTLRPDVPVLLATGRPDQTALALVADYSGVTLLSKPFSLHELREQLECIAREIEVPG